MSASVTSTPRGGQDPRPVRPPPSLSPEDELSRGLRTIRALGAGGQGAVLLARDEHLARDVAVKFLDAASSGDVRERLRVEARAMARVRHPAVVQVFDVGELEGRPFLVMEYIRGETLQDRLSEEAAPVALGEALPLLEQIAEGLVAVHGADLAHGDLQPANVLVGADHQVRVADFGLSFIHGGGTAHYMAPELQGEGPLDVRTRQRSDLYAWGVLAFQLLTGERPFDAPDRARVLAQHRYKEAPSLRERRPDLTAELVQLVDACLAKRADDRPAGAVTIARSLRCTMDLLRRPSFRRVLIVDDDPAFRALLRAHLEESFEGLRVVEAGGGAEALEQCRREPFELVLLDLHMPEVNGIELAAALRADEGDGPRLVVLTGRGSAADWAVLRSMGADALLAKPIDEGELRATVERVLYGRG